MSVWLRSSKGFASHDQIVWSNLTWKWNALGRPMEECVIRISGNSSDTIVCDEMSFKHHTFAPASSNVFESCIQMAFTINDKITASPFVNLIHFAFDFRILCRSYFPLDLRIFLLSTPAPLFLFQRSVWENETALNDLIYSFPCFTAGETITNCRLSNSII